jgi:hypothetical protein
MDDYIFYFYEPLKQFSYYGLILKGGKPPKNPFRKYYIQNILAKKPIKMVVFCYLKAEG